jgi:histone H3/H4
MAELLVVQSKVKAYVKGKKLRMSGDAVGAINGELKALLDKAVARCKGNKRQTVKASDI